MSQVPPDKMVNPFGDAAGALSGPTTLPTPGMPIEKNLFSDPTHGPPRGMVGQVVLLGSFMIGQAALFLLMGSFAILMVVMVNVLPVPAQNGADLQMVGVVYGFVAAITLPLGLLHLVAGICVLRFKARVFGFSVVLIGLLSVMTGLCAPTAIALAVYGLLVLVNDSVVLAFQLGQEGKSRAEILLRFPPV